MAKQQEFRKYDEAVALLRNDGFDVQSAPGAANRVVVTKYNCSAAIERNAKGGVAISTYPGPVIAGETGKLVHKGYQQVFKTSNLEVAATADRLKQLAQFTNELKRGIGSLTLWNESLGTVSEDYLYDRLKSRDLPESERPKRPWDEAAPVNGKQTA
jgi:hypothetical protein